MRGSNGLQGWSVALLLTPTLSPQAGRCRGLPSWFGAA
jgi:hypothetical protein